MLSINDLDYLIKRHRPNRSKSEIYLAGVYKKHSFKKGTTWQGREEGRLTNPAITQAQNPGYELV